MTNKKIFREKSLERISSPEQLNEYIKVSSPGVWMAMIAVIILLAGALVWAICGRVDVYVPAVVSASAGQTTLYVPCDGVDDKTIESDIHFTTESGDYTLTDVKADATPTEVTRQLLDTLDARVTYEGELSEGSWIYIVEGNSTLTDGIYDCRVVTEEYAPIEFITD